MSVLYDCIHSDHHPVSFSIDSDVVPECVNSSVDTNDIKQVIHWDTPTSDTLAGTHYSHKILTHIKNARK